MYFCWICNSEKIKPIQQKLNLSRLTPEDLKISDFQYGVSLKRFQCINCRFVFCPTATETLGFYSEMIDSEYVNDSELRIYRAKDIVDKVVHFKNTGLWLDVGAGTGEVVQASKEAGFQAIGLEPSNYLANVAAKLGREVLQENLFTFNADKFDVISFIDVIEHVEKPKELLSKAKSLLKPAGILVIVTPDISSFAARLFRNSWWHIRPAHIGYFSRVTLGRLLSDLNFQILSMVRPPRLFYGGYIARRLSAYLPAVISNWLERIFSDIVIKFNIHDEIMIIAVSKGIELAEQ